MVVSDVAQPFPESRTFYSSLVVEHIVATARNAEFETWRDKLAQTVSDHPGFTRLDSVPPLRCEDEVTKWYSIVHFDSPEHLKGWVDSTARQALLADGQDIFRAYRFKSFTTGLEGWFSQAAGDREQSGLGPPAWKQILSVVFGLYPLVMVRLKLFPGTGLIGSWSPSGAMLLATLVTSSILGILVMPVLARLLGFWLYPAYRRSRWKADALGVGIVVAGMALMVSVFDRL